MTISEISVPEVYKQSADFRFFLKWIEVCFARIQNQTDNLIDLFHQIFCILSWDQNMLIHTERVSHEILFPCNVLQGDTLCTHLKVSSIFPKGILFHRIRRRGQKPAISDIACMKKQNSGIEFAVRDMGFFQLSRALYKGLS